MHFVQDFDRAKYLTDMNMIDCGKLYASGLVLSQNECANKVYLITRVFLRSPTATILGTRLMPLPGGPFGCGLGGQQFQLGAGAEFSDGFVSENQRTLLTNQFSACLGGIH